MLQITDFVIGTDSDPGIKLSALNSLHVFHKRFDPFGNHGSGDKADRHGQRNTDRDDVVDVGANPFGFL